MVVAWGQRSDTNLLSALVRDSVKHSVKNKVVPFQRKLPKWWPTVINSSASVFDANEQEEYKREAYRVVRGLFFEMNMGGFCVESHLCLVLAQKSKLLLVD